MCSSFGAGKADNPEIATCLEASKQKPHQSTFSLARGLGKRQLGKTKKILDKGLYSNQTAQ